jgi:hypothetical protein
MIKAIGYGIIEKRWNPEKPLRDKENSLHQKLQVQVQLRYTAEKELTANTKTIMFLVLA